MQDIAERLIAYETRANKSSGAKIPVACLVSQKLHPPLATLMGDTGFRSLLSRALVLAGTDVAWLRAVHVKSDGSLEGLDELETQLDPDELLEGCVVLLAQLLGLLTTFIGAQLTLRLARDVWPKLSLNDLDFGKGNKNAKPN